MTRALALAVAVAGLAALPGRAGAAERYAVIVGNNHGEADEQDLRYAESDAARMAEVLRDLGGFRTENVMLLRGRGGSDVRLALAALEQRIAARGGDAMLLVYYSGHADARALHLGDDPLPLAELERLVLASRATVRLLVVDSCRSGALTRRKGGRPVAGFAVDLDDSLSAQGVVTLTASAATEDAQESDELGGSFFTHHFISGLLGAADTSGDGVVSLAEAYRHAYEATVRATSRTMAGIQHATFRYDLSGQGDLALTRLAGRPGQRAWLGFPREHSYLILRNDEDGAVVGEVGLRDARRRISLRPGRYFVRGRGRDHLLEGTIRLAAGADRVVVDRNLRRIEYARLVRKGGGLRPSVSGAELGFRVRAPIDNGAWPCLGAFAGHVIQLPTFMLAFHGTWCRSGYNDVDFESVVDEVDVMFRIGKAWDLRSVTITPFVGTSGGLFYQRFTTRGDAPSRLTQFGRLVAGLGFTQEIRGGSYVLLEATAELYAYPQEGAPNQVDLTAGLSAGFGWPW